MIKPKLSRRKLILFSVIPTILFLALIIGAELILRITVPSFDNPFVREIKSDGIEWYQINRRFLAKYFPNQQTVIPELRASVFRKVKNRNTYRIVCLGSSSMFGTPYEMNANIAAIVRKQLRHLFPDQEIEVINLGASAINSNVILDLFKNIKQYHPDLVLVYMGHNEFYGPDGVGASFLQRTFPSTIPFVYSLRDIRLFQMFQSLFTPQGGSEERRERNLMKLVSQNTAISLSSPDAKRILQLFHSNLEHIIHSCQEDHIPLIVSDLTSNLDFPPFLSDTIRGTRNWQDFCASVQQKFDSGRYSFLRDTLSAIERQDSSNAYINYWLGQTERMLGHPEIARPLLVRARDNDLLKFRAPQAVNDIIRNLCTVNAVPFFSSDSLFAALSPGGIPGRNLFWEHLHPTAQGYYEIANSFVHAMAASHYLPGQFQEPVATPLLPWNTDSLSICWLDLAYGDIAMRNLTMNWPFSNYRVPSVVMANADDQLRQIALDTYMSKIPWSEGCYKSVFYFERSGNFRAAQTTLEALLEDYPFSFYAHYLLGNVQKETNNINAAFVQYKRSIELNPEYLYPYIDLGLLEINNGMLAEATRDLQTALRLSEGKSMPLEQASIYYGLSAIAANNGEMTKALEYTDQSLRMNPGYRAAQTLRANLLKVLPPR